jgi:hypothetical protein
VGGSTAGTLAANALVPGLLDRYLARTGFDSQQTEHERPAHQRANLWQPADGTDGEDYGAHGMFDDRAHKRSVQLWASQHHGLLTGTALGAVTAVAGVASQRLRSGRRITGQG